MFKLTLINLTIIWVNNIYILLNKYEIQQYANYYDTD